MRREAFGALAALSDGDLAQALVGVAVSSYRLTAPMSFGALAKRLPRLFSERDGPGGRPLREATLPFSEFQRYAASARGRMGVPAALDAWRRFVGGEKGPLTRYCVDLRGARNDPNRQIDLDWLLSLLGNESIRSASTFAAWPTESSSYEWEWPLRIGIAPGPSADELRPIVERCTPHSLFSVVDLTASGARCDIALFSSSLRDAVRSAMEIPNVRASAALVLGGLSAPWSQAGPWLAGLRRQLHAGATSTCFVPASERGIWLQSLLQELSHNKTLDHALFEASDIGLRAQQAWCFPEAGVDRPALEPPLVLADREFLSHTRMAETAKRIAAAAVIASPVPVSVEMPYSWTATSYRGAGRLLPLPEAGAVLTSLAETLPWAQESGDATSLRQFRESVQTATGNALELPRITVGMPVARRRGRTPVVLGATPPAPPAAAFQARASARPGTRRARRAPLTAGPTSARAVPRPQAPRVTPPRRRVQLNVFRASDGSRAAVAEPSTDYSVDVFVSPDRTGHVQANKALDESTLPASSAGHQLRVALTPLWRDSEGKIPPAQMLDVHMPATGPSSKATFHFRTPQSVVAFRARLIVLSQFRVLQTLMLDCTADAGVRGGAFVLTEENLVSTDFGQRTIAPPFEAALVVNDSPSGVPGLTAIAGGSAQFFEPAGLDVLLKQMRDDLGTLNASEELTGDKLGEVILGLDDERIHGLMFRLALRGAALAKELRRQPLIGAFLSAPRLQVVDAVSDAFFPIELVYDGKAPLEGAQRCEHSIAALEDQSVHDACPNRKSNEYFCPAAFWGFQKCIERQSSSTGQPGFFFSQPVVSSSSLRPLRSVLFAASQRVRQVDITPPVGLEAIFTAAGMSFGLAKTWKDWTTQIGVATPSMLVLLPHSLNSAALADLPTFEVGGGELASTQMDESYVHGPGDERPVVLLLGCSTAVADIPFLGFVREFRCYGAAVTIGTLATIRGRQTVEFVREFLAQLKQVAAEELTFDEAILRVKRRMLAKGDPFVLSLVAYGDTGWRVKS